MTQKYGLGRGLSSLIPQKGDSVHMSRSQKPRDQRQYDEKTDVSAQAREKNIHLAEDGQDYIKEISIGNVRANSQQPRIYFDEEKLEELTASIKTHGVLQPLIAVDKGDHFELIAGERRLRASKKAGLKTVPVVVKKDCGDLNEQKKLELALIENIQRHDLNVIEEAKSYYRLAEEFNLSQEEIAVRSGKSRSAVANRIRLISLPIEIQKSLIAGEITEGHAKVILSITQSQRQLALYRMIVQQNLTVRQAEDKARSVSNEENKKRSAHKTPHARRLEDQLTQYFGTRVRVSEGANGGNITVSYFSEEDLKTILTRLKLV